MLPGASCVGARLHYRPNEQCHQDASAFVSGHFQVHTAPSARLQKLAHDGAPSIVCRQKLNAPGWGLFSTASTHPRP